MHKAAGGFGGLNVYQRPRIPKPYATPDGDFTLLIGDWYKADHKVRKIQNSHVSYHFHFSFLSFFVVLQRLSLIHI